VTARAPDQRSTDKLRDVYRFTLARIGGEGHSIGTVAEACGRTEDQVRSAIRKIRKQGDGSVSWAQLYEVLGV